ncbi:MAG: hypothetical protein WAO08_35955 [Hyphomicrobiaceae bacterium]
MRANIRGRHAARRATALFNIDPPTTMHETEQRIAWFSELWVECGLPREFPWHYDDASKKREIFGSI